METKFDKIFDIDTWKKGGFVNHYKTLLEGNNNRGYDSYLYDYYILEHKNIININKKPVVIYGLMQMLQFSLNLLDSFTYYISFIDSDDGHKLHDLETQRHYSWNFIQRNIDIIKILLPIYKPLLLSNNAIITHIKEEGDDEYINNIEYGKELLQMCGTLDPNDFSQYDYMFFPQPRPKSGNITEMEGLICDMSESTRSNVGLESYQVKWVKSLFDLSKRQSLLRKLKLLDPFFVNCLQERYLSFEGNDLIINDELVEHVTSFHVRDEGSDDVKTRTAKTLLRVFGREELPDSWPFFEPMNLGIVKLRKNNLYSKWIIHLQNNLKDWNDRFENEYSEEKQLERLGELAKDEDLQKKIAELLGCR